MTEALALESTADLCDRLGAQVRVCRLLWHCYGGRRAASGSIATVQCLDDAALLRAQLAQPGLGRLLVVDGGASLRTAILGDRMARLALDSGWAGLVIHGAVRDVARLRAMDIAVLALGQVPRRGGRTGAGRHGVELCFGEAVFRPGEWACLDEDGLVVLERAPG